jgi:hypothetical protein
MVTLLLAMLAYVRAFLMPRHSLLMETAALVSNLALQTETAAPKLNESNRRLFWVVVRRVRNNWSEALILVKPETVISWHRAG